MHQQQNIQKIEKEYTAERERWQKRELRTR